MFKLLRKFKEGYINFSMIPKKLNPVVITKELLLGNIQRVYKEKDYKFFEGDTSINVFAVRCLTGTDMFDDYVGVAYYSSGELELDLYPATTEPGRHWLLNPLRDSGCAIMKEGQYLGAYAIGGHGRRKYPALRQVKPIPVYRDNNLDKNHDLDESTVDIGIHYTNIHHGYGATLVRKNSAGCIVIQSNQRFNDAFMPLARRSAEIYGNSFTFTLLNINDFK
jgi:hypothetical protein